MCIHVTKARNYVTVSNFLGDLLPNYITNINILLKCLSVSFQNMALKHVFKRDNIFIIFNINNLTSLGVEWQQSMLFWT